MKKTLLLSISLFNLFFVSAQTTSLQWAKSMGGNEQDILNAMATDASGALIMTGSFKGTADFDPGPGVANLTSSNFDDIFISKLDASGNFLWAKQIGAALGDFGRSITTDKSGNIYVTGSFQGTADFDPGAGIVNLISYGASDVFVLKLNTSGNLIWARRMGGAADQQGYAIAVDSSGNVYTGGSFRETSDFDPGVGTSNYTSVGSSDIFFSKLDSSGNFVWAERFGGVNYDDLYSIALDNTGALYSTGSFQGLAFNLVSAGQDDIFISKLNANGKFVWAKRLGGTFVDQGLSICIDGQANIYSTGRFMKTSDFDPGSGVSNLVSMGGSDVYISKLDSAGNFIWGKRFGGVYDDYGLTITLDSRKNIYTTGGFQATVDFDPGTSRYDLTAINNFDIYLSKLDSFGNFAWSKAMGGNLVEGGSAIVVDAMNNVFTAGGYQGTVDFDPGFGVYNLTAAGETDIFLNKLSQFPVGIKQYSSANNIEAYPNPNNGVFSIRVTSELTREARIEIYNSMGVLIYSQNSINENNAIELIDQPNGLYFIKLVDGKNEITTIRILKTE